MDYFAIGRLQPAHEEHRELLELVTSLADKAGGKAYLGLIETKRRDWYNPLSYGERVEIIDNFDICGLDIFPIAFDGKNPVAMAGALKVVKDKIPNHSVYITADNGYNKILAQLTGYRHESRGRRNISSSDVRRAFFENGEESDAWKKYVVPESVDTIAKHLKNDTIYKILREGEPSGRRRKGSVKFL